MKYLRINVSFLFILLMLACENPNQFVDDDKTLPPREAVWICHHPDTEFHDRECVEEIYPRGCYSDNGTNAYCWLLSKGHCDIFTGDSRLEWQKKYCPLLEE